MAWTDYRELEVWKKAHVVTLQIYTVTRDFPREEVYGLVSQMRRAAVSIESNLAEGKSRTGRAEFAHFVSLAAGSAAELECQLLIAFDVGYLKREQYEALHPPLTEVRRMLTALRSSLTPNA